MEATLCTSQFCAVSCPRYDVGPSLQPITANLRLMPKGELLVRAADFFPRLSLTFQLHDGSKGISPPSPQKTTGN
ncbi:hypothetical protein INR49_012369 [Caranx melampygus]|nr:hypothetical protein INR49_012369 [Caranx melampygus]